MIFSPSDLLALCQRHGAPPGVARIAAACALVESGGNTDAVGDNGHSVGLFQMHDAGLGAGMTVAERQDPDTAAAVMLPQFVANWIAGQVAGYTGEQLARYVAIWTERPQGWPDLDSAAADRYAAMWATLQEPDVNTGLRQAFLDKIRSYWGKPYVFGGKSPATSFDCSGLLTYCGRAVGVDLGDPLMTSADGLKQYCDAVTDGAALPGDLLLFSQTYGDTGPDYATHCGASLGAGTGQMLDTHEGPGVGQANIYQPYWQQHFIGVWRPRAFAMAPTPEPAPFPDGDPCAPLISQLGYLQGDVADALQRGVDGARIAKTKAQRDAAYQSIEAAIATLRRGGG